MKAVDWEGASTQLTEVGNFMEDEKSQTVSSEGEKLLRKLLIFFNPSQGYVVLVSSFTEQ